MSILPPSRSPHSIHAGNTDDAIAAARDSQLQHAAEQFEALFLQQVLKQMRKAGDALSADNSMRSREMGVMRDFYDGALADTMAGQRQTGIADMLVRQLSGNQSQMDINEAGIMARNADLPFRTDPNDPFRTRTETPSRSFKALVDSVTRHESAGQIDAVSPKGARGLMQLMPSTAREMAAELGLPFNEAWLTIDGGYNQRLGGAYLAKMLNRYDGEPALAVAAYNAGPGRVDEWLRVQGDPRKDDITMREWVDKIPFQETRNYTAKILKDLGKAGLIRENLYAVAPFKQSAERVALQEKAHPVDADTRHQLRSAAFAQQIRIEPSEKDL